MTAWEYVGVDVASGQVLESLPVQSDVKFSRVLNGAGGFSGTLALVAPIGEAGPLRWARDVLDATDPGRRAIYALADGRPMWGGWIDPRSRVGLTVGAVEWGGYFAKRRLREDVNPDGLPGDQLNLARMLVASAQAFPGGDVHVALDTTVSSGVLREVGWLVGDVPIVAEQLATLADADDGFDYAWPVEWADATHLRGRLLLGYPRLGSDTVEYVVDHPSTVVEVTGFDESAADMATHSLAVGRSAAGGDASPMRENDPAASAALLAAGYPVLDRVERYQDIDNEDELQAHADADQRAHGGILVTVKARVPERDVIDGLVGLGDPVRIEMSGAAFPDGFVEDLRCTQIDFEPAAERCDLTLSPRVIGGGRVPRAETTEMRLARLNREVRVLTVVSP